MELRFELLKELTQAWGVAGREKAVRAIIRREVENDADEITKDAMGNLIVLKRGNGASGGKKIMLSAHMDEIGFQVTKIEADGRLRIASVGFTWNCAVYNDTLVFRNGVIGVVGCDIPVEETKNKPQKLYVDIGCTTKEDTEKYVKIGDYCGMLGEYRELQNGRIVSKSFDDRVGCFVLLEALKRNDGSGPNDVYYVFSVQEEIGCRGAVTAANRIRPDIGVSVDVTPDHFYPSDLDGCNAVGAGVGVKIGDPSAVLDEELTDALIDCCEKEEIAYQRDVMDRGGTDAASINKSGIGTRVCGISIVDRFPHSQSSIIAKSDVEAAVKLTAAFTGRSFCFDEA